MIVKCKQKVIDNIRKERETQGVDRESINQEIDLLGRTLSFGRIGKACLGRPGLLAVNVSVMVTQFGFTIGYFIFMGNTLRSILKFYLIPDEPFHNVTNTTTTNFTTLQPITTTVTTPKSYQSNFTTAMEMNSSLLFPTADLGIVNDTTVFTFLRHHLGNLHEAVKDPWSAANLVQNSTITFGVLILFPLPILIGIAFVRNLRKLGPVSVIANTSITGAGIITAVYMFASMFCIFTIFQFPFWYLFPILRNFKIGFFWEIDFTSIFPYLFSTHNFITFFIKETVNKTQNLSFSLQSNFRQICFLAQLGICKSLLSVYILLLYTDNYI